MTNVLIDSRHAGGKSDERHGLLVPNRDIGPQTSRKSSLKFDGFGGNGFGEGVVDCQKQAVRKRVEESMAKFERINQVIREAIVRQYFPRCGCNVGHGFVPSEGSVELPTKS
ncbi:hypothetical protein RB4301 [Rhodopirellula baltica SH 1]|uniref:Uncharacterized protein n=1 Tax=Rhodopirellula baltica (strain DSM 10527 / NCIMB 13988 / SH1) TaxID=243090 RepID=Q7UST9_RHOBA|nr:hypothetical protein RB4301 [Rhodopirellula baltica SH 1]